MPTKITFIFFILGILILASCAKEPEEPACNDFTLPGVWIWTKTEGLSGTNYAPEGYINKIEIGDSTWREFVNDSLIFESMYTVRYDSTGYLLHQGDIFFNNQFAKGFLFAGCSLIFMGGWNDSPEIYYERK
jgi:hypothetical protein